MSDDEAKRKRHKNVHKTFYEKYAPSSGPNPLNKPPDPNKDRPQPNYGKDEKK